MFTQAQTVYPSQLSKASFDLATLTPEEVVERLTEEAIEHYEARATEIGEEEFRNIERRVLLSVLDQKWREHLYEMDYLQEGIGLRAVGQRDPLIEYQREGFAMFQAMQDTIKDEFVQYMMHVQVVKEQAPTTQRMQLQKDDAAQAGALQAIRQGGADGSGGLAEEMAPAQQQVFSEKVPRNAPCPCGSGKKFKKCHGMNA
jgi:preprotein translocase subunit SecA